MTPATWIPARGSRRRIQALVNRGWSRARLARALRISLLTLDALLQARCITRSAHNTVAAVFSGLWDRRPPLVTDRDRAEYESALEEAQVNGWLSPLAWDDIDDDDSPAEQEILEPAAAIDEIAIELAIAGKKIHLTHPERLEALHRLCDRGVAQSRIAEILRMNAATAKQSIAVYVGATEQLGAAA